MNTLNRTATPDAEAVGVIQKIWQTTNEQRAASLLKRVAGTAAPAAPPPILAKIIVDVPPPANSISTAKGDRLK